MRRHLRTGSPSDYQEDHLMSLELGGHPTDARNLWPEPYPRSRPVDGIENELNALVCSGKLSLAEAQRREPRSSRSGSRTRPRRWACSMSTPPRSTATSFQTKSQVSSPPRFAL